MVQFGLVIVALLLLGICIVPSIICSIVLLFVKDDRRLYKGVAIFLKSIALVLDILGNVLCQDLFNLIFIKHGEGSYKFGVVGETVSSALGKNQLMGTPSKTGWFIIKALDKVEKDHCIKWIDNRFTN